LKENLHIEFKSGFNEDVIETPTAFADTKGGKVLAGVRDDSTVVADKDTEKRTFMQEVLLREIANNKFITTPELNEKVKINIRNTKNISKINSKGLLKRVGSDKGNYWQVIDHKKYKSCQKYHNPQICASF
jgi:predicted HTH transcriptional regulator